MPTYTIYTCPRCKQQLSISQGVAVYTCPKCHAQFDKNQVDRLVYKEIVGQALAWAMGAGFFSMALWMPLTQQLLSLPKGASSPLALIIVLGLGVATGVGVFKLYIKWRTEL